MVIVFQMNGDNPYGVSRLSGNIAPAGTLECTQAQADEYTSKGSTFPGTDTYRFTYIADVLTELADSRTLVTWAPDGNGTVDGQGNVRFNLDVGDAEPNVGLSLPGSASRTDRVDFQGELVKVTFVNGVATLPIKTDVARRLVIRSSNLYRMSNKLTVHVHAVKL